MPGLLIVIIIIGLIIVANGIRIINQYERGVVFRLGKVQGGVKQPGLRLIIPIIDQMRKVALRTVTLPIETQKIITRDNVSIDVAAVAYYQVVDPIKAIVEIENVVSATYQIAQTTVRNVVGQTTLDHVLSETAALNDKVKAILDQATEKWGIYVSNVELKDIQLPDSMQRAMAKEAEAEREKRAKIIAAEGEKLSATSLGDAADIINAHPIALQLRNLQVLAEISSEKNSTIIFPAQFMDTIQSVKQFIDKREVMPLSDYQQRVDQFVQSREKPYWSPLSQLGFLIEEVGELSRLLNHLYGDKPKKASETKQELVGELGDVQFAIVCIANREGIDLDQALSLTIDKTKTRDKDRFKKKS